MDAFYTFKIVTPIDLTRNARVYLEFPWGIPPRLNKDGFIECYMRLSTTTE